MKRRKVVAMIAGGSIGGLSGCSSVGRAGRNIAKRVRRARIREDLREEVSDSSGLDDTDSTDVYQIGQEKRLEPDQWVWWELNLLERTSGINEVSISYTVSVHNDHQVDIITMNEDEYDDFEAGNRYYYYDQLSSFESTWATNQGRIPPRDLYFLIHNYQQNEVSIDVELSVSEV